MKPLISELDRLLQELAIIDVLEEKLNRIVGLLQRTLNPQSIGIFKLREQNLQLKISRNISHIYTKNTLIGIDAPLIKKLKEKRFLNFEESDEFKFEHDYSHLLISALEVNHQLQGFLFVDISSGTFDNEQQAVFRIVASLTALVMTNDLQAKNLAKTIELDEETYLYRSKAFYEKGSYLFNLLHRTPIKMSLTVLKLNRYSDYVRKYGNSKTKETINIVLHSVKKGVRPIDIIGSLFDNTYVILLPNKSADQTYKYISQIEKSLAELEQLKELNISWGISDLKRSTGSFQELVGNAEEAAFDGSRSDTDQIIIYEE